MNLLGRYFSTNNSNLSKKTELTFYWLDIRGGVEDTRLEAKAEAKDRKKNPRPRIAFPRTDTLEAKDRNA